LISSIFLSEAAQRRHPKQGPFPFAATANSPCGISRSHARAHRGGRLRRVCGGRASGDGKPGQGGREERAGHTRPAQAARQQALHQLQQSGTTICMHKFLDLCLHQLQWSTPRVHTPGEISFHGQIYCSRSYCSARRRE
jgi:hypothetical protein